MLIEIDRCALGSMVVALGCLSVIATTAQATPITYGIDGVVVSASMTDPGLRVFVDDSVLDSNPFTLDDGESATIDLFIIGTNEFSVNFDDIFPKLIEFDLQLFMPSIQATVGGISRGTWRILDDIGKVRWDGPVIIDSGVSIFELTLGDVDFGTPGSAVVSGTFRQLSSVPEPATAVFVMLGLTGIAAKERRRVGAHN